MSISGKDKIEFCRRLGLEWHDLVDYFEISSNKRAQFDKGRECQAILDWLENSNQFEQLSEALEFIGRDDLLSLVQPNQPKRLKTFKPLASVIKTKNTQQLFNNQWLYFTPAEEQMMRQIGQRLEDEHQVLLLGNPATGKSIMAFAIAAELEAIDYEVYYWSLARSDKGLWDDIEALLSRKALFIIDDCHLDIDSATALGFKFHNLSNVSAALLFISRNISKNLQESLQSEWFKLFEELKTVTFHTESHHLETKVSGIIAKYQAYYQRQASDCQYVVGDEAVIMRNIRKSLVTLSYFLNLWKEIAVLSDISEAQVLETVYDKYFRRLALSQSQIACLLQYACLYAFEIEFERLPDKKETTELLAINGIILKAGKHVYSFYHSDFADLLLRAYEAYEESRFQRKYNTFDNFLWKQIKSYLLSFVADYGYPVNVHSILYHIAGSKNVFLLEKLLADEDLKALIVAFYAEETDRIILLQFVIDVLSKNTPILFNEYFKALFDSEYFKEVFFRAKNSFIIYVNILKNLRKNEVAYNAFLANWEEQESALIKQAGISIIGHGLRNLQLHISQDKAKQLYDCFDSAFFIAKIQEANLAQISGALIKLNQVNSSQTKAIFGQIDNAFLIAKIQEANLVEIGHALIELNQVNSSQTKAIFEQVDDALLIEKIQKANLVNIARALIELNQVNSSQTKAIFEQVDDALLIEKIQKANLVEIGHALIELNQVNSSQTKSIFEQIDNEFFIDKIQEANLVEIGHALNELNQVDSSQTKAIFENIDDNLFSQKFTQLNFCRLANALSELNKISNNKTQSIFKIFEPKIQTKSFTQEIKTTNYNEFLKFISIFPKLDAGFGKLLLQNIDESYLFKWGKLKNTKAFNLLLNTFRLAEISKEDKNLKQLISFAQTNMNILLTRRRISDIGSFLRLLANYINIQPIIEQNLRRFVGKIHYEEDQTKIPIFIYIIHANAPDSAFYLFEQLKEDYPDAQEIIGFTHYYIGKNYYEQLQLKKATHHLEIAEAIFIDINHEIGFDLVQTELEPINS